MYPNFWFDTPDVAVVKVCQPALTASFNSSKCSSMNRELTNCSCSMSQSASILAPPPPPNFCPENITHYVCSIDTRSWLRNKHSRHSFPITAQQLATDSKSSSGFHTKNVRDILPHSCSDTTARRQVFHSFLLAAELTTQSSIFVLYWLNWS